MKIQTWKTCDTYSNTQQDQWRVTSDEQRKNVNKNIQSELIVTHKNTAII